MLEAQHEKSEKELRFGDCSDMAEKTAFSTLSQGGHLKTRLGISNLICKCGLVCSKYCHPAR